MEHFIKILKILGQIIAIIISAILLFAIYFLSETQSSMTEKTLRGPISIGDFFLVCIGIGLMLWLAHLSEKKENSLQS